jgi:hypothetical protein
LYLAFVYTTRGLRRSLDAQVSFFVITPARISLTT